MRTTLHLRPAGPGRARRWEIIKGHHGLRIVLALGRWGIIGFARMLKDPKYPDIHIYFYFGWIAISIPNPFTRRKKGTA